MNLFVNLSLSLPNRVYLSILSLKDKPLLSNTLLSDLNLSLKILLKHPITNTLLGSPRVNLPQPLLLLINILSINVLL